jgi:hypothetical protein
VLKYIYGDKNIEKKIRFCSCFLAVVYEKYYLECEFKIVERGQKIGLIWSRTDLSGLILLLLGIHHLSLMLQVVNIIPMVNLKHQKKKGSVSNLEVAIN